MMRANDRLVAVSAQCCSRHLVAGVYYRVARLGSLESLGRSSWWKRTPRDPRMGTNSTWGGRKWPARDPCPLVIWAIWALETQRAIIDESFDVSLLSLRARPCLV